ncbi:LOW QUALITY PROTEIN: VQ motif-containing protein 4-like [Eucalyptus grandis]|uniref:LOW QUALITY PROTEIN: VQ motif-containing protein 4-like n=1 Tax=Eucalyptus grandis TaxID=71139 RepID=UPI00192E9263|nr:LOW QUALITY PROTEIN: VQ motif-containing protein 4-like [Eucalyptus grandis]
MESSPNHQESSSPPSLLPSPTSHSVTTTSSSSSNTNSPRTAPSPKPLTRSEPANPYPTTFVQADTSSFKQVVQMLTGSPTTASSASASAAAAASKPDPSPPSASKIHNPPIKSMPKKSSSGSGFKLYERRNSLKNFKINPLVPFSGQAGPGFSPRKPEILSPSILDFPSLVLSPVTPLIHDPFNRSSAAAAAANCAPDERTESPSLDPEAEERAIREKGFFLHPSPATTPREAEPRLLPLFPVSSPRVSGSSSH